VQQSCGSALAKQQLEAERVQRLDNLDQEDQDHGQGRYEWVEALGRYQQKDENNVQQGCNSALAEQQLEVEQAATALRVPQ
jgi:hypothetical protein